MVLEFCSWWVRVAAILKGIFLPLLQNFPSHLVSLYIPEAPIDKLHVSEYNWRRQPLTRQLVRVTANARQYQRGPMGGQKRVGTGTQSVILLG